MEPKAVKIVEKLCKTALSRSGLSYDYTINPYTGCLHGCIYCYANFMRRFSNHLQDPWGSFVDVKVNLLDVLAKELPKRPGGSVWLSSVCDPYQEVEAKYNLTRGAIELLSSYRKFSISILTKNALVLRDLDLLTHIKDRLDIGFTITTFDPDAQRIFEPYASPLSDRIDALTRLSSEGFDTWVFIAPMLPYVTEVMLEEGLKDLAETGVKKLMTDRYNARGMIINQTLRAYERWNPTIDLQQIRQLLWKGDEYYNMLEDKISKIWKTEAPNVNYARDMDWHLAHKSEL
ncbi:MAG: radical SAM protein [Candidatus Bathyarchaeia archaeon]